MTNPLDDLVGPVEIAERLGVTRSTVSIWALRRETCGFPLELIRISSHAIYSWKQIEKWAIRTGRPVVSPPKTKRRSA